MTQSSMREISHPYFRGNNKALAFALVENMKPVEVLSKGVTYEVYVITG